MIFEIDPTGTLSGFQTALKRIETEPEVKGILILACDANRFTPAEVDPLLRSTDKPLFGGIFPEIILGREKYTTGTIVAGLMHTPEIHRIDGLSDPTADFDDALDHHIPEVGAHETMVVLVDGLSTRISGLVDGLFNAFGLEINYIGGGAGSLSFEQKPCLMTADGLVEDCAVIALLPTRSGIGVKHGWEVISGPFKATEVERNVIKTLDWRPAIDVYGQVVEAAAGCTLTEANFFDIAKGFPFGINRLDAEKIVRDPIVLRPDGALVCVGEVPEGSYVSILSGSVPSLVQAAGQALKQGLAVLPTRSGQETTFFIDCISRVLFLEDEFRQELDEVYRPDQPLLGALTLGEIANSGQDYLEFYNKTAVVAVMDGV